MNEEETTPTEPTPAEETETPEIAPEQPRQVTVLEPMPAYKTQETGVMNPVEYQQMKQIAKDFLKSKALPSGFANEEQVLVAILAGKEMGMRPYESVRSMYFVNGRLNIYGDAITRRLRTHGWQIEYKNESPASVTATVSKGHETYTETYTFQEAEQSGYTKDSSGRLKIGWREGLNRRLKLRYGVLAIIIKTYIPEILGEASNIVEVEEDFTPDKHTFQIAGETIVKPDTKPTEDAPEPEIVAQPLAPVSVDELMKKQPRE